MADPAAAVTGVIASLALFFIANIAHRTGATGQFISQLEVALALALVAALALLRYKLGVMAVMAGCALAGLALRSAGWA